MITAGLLSITSFVSFVCWIMLVFTAFKKEDSPLLGILSLFFCGLGAFIIGWVKCKDWGINQLMTVYSIAIIVSAVLQIAANPFMGE